MLLNLLPGFSFPVALPLSEQRSQLVIDEANSIYTVEQRALMLPEPFCNKMLQLLGRYLEALLEFEGYNMRCRCLLAVFVLPLTLAFVLTVVSELDSLRTRFVWISQQSMQRLQLELKAEIVPRP